MKNMLLALLLAASPAAAQEFASYAPAVGDILAKTRALQASLSASHAATKLLHERTPSRWLGQSRNKGQQLLDTVENIIELMEHTQDPDWLKELNNKRIALSNEARRLIDARLDTSSAEDRAATSALEDVHGAGAPASSPNGNFEVIGIMLQGCSATWYYESRSRCFSQAITILDDGHLNSIRGSCTGLLSWKDESDCFIRALGSLSPTVFRDYAGAKGMMRQMCTSLRSWQEEATCFDKAALQAGGHFLPIRETCSPSDYYESRVRCFEKALE